MAKQKMRCATLKSVIVSGVLKSLKVCRLSVSLLSGREARIDITSQMRIAALKDAAERELECSIYALFKDRS